MRRLSVLVTVLCICEVVFAQHPHARGGSSLYWALVGGVGALFIYFGYQLLVFLGNLIKYVRGLSRDI